MQMLRDCLDKLNIPLRELPLDYWKTLDTSK
jgi:hypothetical protein